MILQASQIFDLARKAGFPLGVAVQMTAIALRESDGDTNAHLVGPVDDSYGLWQINMLGELGPARAKQFGFPVAASYPQLFDPSQNARAAFLTWNWSTANMNIAWAINRGIWQARYQFFMKYALQGALSSGVAPATIRTAVIGAVGPLSRNAWLGDLFGELKL